MNIELAEWEIYLPLVESELSLFVDNTAQVLIVVPFDVDLADNIHRACSKGGHHHHRLRLLFSQGLILEHLKYGPFGKGNI